MAVDIGPKIGVEGEAEYRKQINQIITQTKTLKSDMKALESTFDEGTSAQEKAAAKVKILNEALAAQNDRVKQVENMYNKSKEALGENATETLKWKQALNNANIEVKETEKELKDAQKAAEGYDDTIEETTGDNKDFTKSIGEMMSGEKLAEFFNKASEAATKFAKAGISAAKELDVGYDTIVTKTGATGESLEELKQIANEVYGSMPVEMADVGAAIGEVNTRLGLSGQELKDTSELFLQFARINNTDVSTSVDTVQKALAAFGLKASDTERILNVMTAAGQDSGVEMTELASAMTKNAAALTEMGLSAEESIVFIGRLEKSGVDSETALSGMSRALKNATKQGIPLNRALANLEDTIINGADGMDGLTASYELFGKSGDKIYNALKTGSISFRDITGDVKDYGDTVRATFENTISPWDKTQQMMNNVKRAGSELAGTAMSTLEPAMSKITDVVQRAADGFSKLPEGVQTTIGAVVGVGTVAAQVVPKVLSFVNTIKSIKTAGEVAKGVRALSGATEGAEKAQKAFNITALANPYVMLAVGVAAATAAIAGLAWKFAEADEKAVQMKADAEALSQAVDATSSASLQATQSATAQVAQMEAQNKVADELVATITELSEKENKSAEEVTQLRTAVKKLNDVYPDLNLQYDETADKLNMTNEELAESIRLTRAQAEAAAYAKILTDAIARQTELEINQEATVKQLTDAYGEYGDTIDKARSRGAANIFDMDTAKTAKTAKETIDTLTASYQQNSQAIDENDAIIETATQHLEELSYSVDPVTGEITDETGAVEDLAGAAEDASESVEGLTEAEEENEEQVKATADEIEAAKQKIVEAYDKTKESAEDSVMKQTGLWDELEQKEATSIEAMRKGLQSHIQAYRDWNSNTTALLNSTEYQTDATFRALVNSIMEGGIGMAGELQAIYEAWSNGDAELMDLISDYGDMSTLAEQFATNTALATTASEYGLEGLALAFSDSGVPDAASGMVNDTSKALNSKALSKSWEVTLGYVNGMSGQSYEETKGLLDSMTRGVQEGSVGLENAEDGIPASIEQTHGQVTAQRAKAVMAGKSVVEGYEAGIRRWMNKPAEAMREVYAASVPDLSTSVTGSAIMAGRELSDKFVTGIQRSESSARSAGESLVAQAVSGITSGVGSASSASQSVANAAKSPLEQLQNHSYEWAKHMMENFNNGIIAMTPRTAEAAKGVADAVKRYLGHSTPEAGPLKDDDVWGLHMAQNIANGMMLGIPIVERASYDMASAAALGQETFDVNMTGGIDADLIYEAVRAGAAQSETTVVIGNREFARVLRDVGVNVA